MNDNGLFEMIKRCKEGGSITTTSRPEPKEWYYNEQGVLKSKPISGAGSKTASVTDVNKAQVIHNFLNSRR